jgi:hypothetical protein
MAPVEAGTDQLFIAEVDFCVSTCTFTWYVEGDSVGQTVDEWATAGQRQAVSMAMGAGRPTFSAQGAIVHRFTPGRHPVKVRAVDAAGHVLWTSTTVIVNQTALPETDAVAVPTSPRTPIFALVVLFGISAFAVLLAWPSGRRRRMPQ